jgi:transcriptional regulator with XRE-family HTH domain
MNEGGLGGRLRRLRGAMSQKDFAHKLGVATATYQNYEYGKRSPDSDFLMRLAEMGARVEWLVTGSGEPFAQTAQEHANSLVAADRVAIGGLGTLERDVQPRPISQPTRLDPTILRAAIEAIEEGLELTGRTASAAAKADLVAKAYELFLSDEAGAGRATGAILRLIRTGT